ncbi:hypothetical protein EOD42_05425 [Rhodovarius crocodyli]|uniref:Uncharacterized protein n=1 Tax=Rhodovarius crocodyli TaxID=1979269 RepID=A0A437MPF6_9PROT|nr:hypothetical protein [Rhodovarius crocodyli]RVT99526.1 hypothetical protein EOD42_05425 [Rhodovarius crocodyli]
MRKMMIVTLALAAVVSMGGAAEARNVTVSGQNWIMGQNLAMNDPNTGATTTTFAQERARRQAIQQSMGQRAMRGGRR